MHNKFESYEIPSSSSRIYNSTDIPNYVEGVEGSALEMQSTKLKYITFSNSSLISPKQFSVSFWIKGNPIPNLPVSPETGYIVSQINPNQKGGWEFITSNMTDLQSQSVHLTVYNSEGKRFSSPDVPIFNNNSYTHIVGSFNGSFVKIYKDGILFGETKFNGTYNNYNPVPIKIGAASDSTMEFYWSGDLDDLQIYNTVLSIDEIRDLIKSLNSTTSITSKNLIGHWPFNGNLDDKSGNDYHGQEYTLISSMVFAPDGRLFFSEKDTGNVKIMKDGNVNSKPFVRISDYYSSWEQGLLGLAVDPAFDQNHFIYLYYTSLDNKTGDPFNRLVRFTDVNGEGTNKTILMDKIPASNGYHSGGALAFGPDEKLYVTIGDATQNTKCGSLPDSTGELCPAQNSSNLLGKVLRINKDGTIPADNPFPGSPVYNIGHRNMYGVAFDKNGFGLVSENGGSLFDEINTNVKGGNYGAPTEQLANLDPELSSNSIPPLRSYYIAKCLTQVVYYDGDEVPHLKDKFLLGNLAGNYFNGKIYAIQVDKIKQQIVKEEVIKIYNSPNNEVVTLATSPKGEIYYGAYTINRLDSVDINDERQIIFPIEINYSSTSSVGDISGIYLNFTGNIMTIDINTNITNANLQNKPTYNDLSNADFSIKIPKELLNDITSINTLFSDGSTDKKVLKNIGYNLQELPNSNHTIVNLLLEEPGEYRISIAGKNATVNEI
jgi:glucose/arabinose dehydrogenase